MMIYLIIHLIGGVVIIFIFNAYNRRYKQFARKYYPDDYKKYSLYPVKMYFIFEADPRLEAEHKKLTARFLLSFYAVFALIYLLIFIISEVGFF